MTYLSKKLQNFYKGSGNQIIFVNGMNLNNLALEIWESLGYQGFDTSVLSRALHGERLFTQKQLNAFCSVLKLNNKQRLELQKSLSKDILKRFKLPENIFDSSTHLIADENLQFIYPLIRILRKSGQPEYSINLSSLLEEYVFPNSKKTSGLKKIIGHVFNEKSRAYGETVRPNEVLKYMQPLNEKAIEIGKDQRSVDILEMTYMNFGGAFYVAKKYEHSINYLEPLLNKVSKNIKLEFIRTLLLDYAYIGNLKGFKKTKRLAYRILDNYLDYDNDLIVSLIESMIRSFSMYSYDGEVQKLLVFSQKLQMSPFFESQLIRGQIFSMYFKYKKIGKIDKNLFFHLYDKAHDRRFTPYKRHLDQIRLIKSRLKLI